MPKRGTGLPRRTYGACGQEKDGGIDLKIVPHCTLPLH
jgi:hypothetical protein